MDAHHHPPPIRLRKHQEWAVYGVVGALFVTGLGWLLLEHFVRVEGSFGPVHHAAQPWLLIAHGVLSAFAIWGFGVMWTFHVRRAWRLKRHRKSGGTMFGLTTLLTLTGLMLYYVGNDTVRGWSSVAHWVFGLAVPVALVVHAVVVPRRERR